MADRPVSLNIPDVIEGQSAMNWITMILARNPLLSALYEYAYAVGARRTSRTIDAKERNLVAALEALPTFAPATPVAPKSVEEMADAIGAECTAPTKPPREMPAPKVGMVYEAGAPPVMLTWQPGSWADVTPTAITRIYWPGPTPVVIWERA